jgi:hypothetical protein
MPHGKNIHNCPRRHVEPGLDVCTHTHTQTHTERERGKPKTQTERAHRLRFIIQAMKRVMYKHDFSQMSSDGCIGLAMQSKQVC